MIANAEKLLTQAEITATSLEGNPNISEEMKKAARAKVDAIKQEIQKNIDYAKEREIIDRTILQEIEDTDTESEADTDNNE